MFDWVSPLPSDRHEFHRSILGPRRGEHHAAIQLPSGTVPDPLVPPPRVSGRGISLDGCGVHHVPKEGLCRGVRAINDPLFLKT